MVEGFFKTMLGRHLDSDVLSAQARDGNLPQYELNILDSVRNVCRAS
jgi:hypothetical protein